MPHYVFEQDASSGAAVIRHFPFTFASSGLFTTGTQLYTPSAGDILLDAWVEIDTIFNGTNPFFDLGTFVSGATTGLWDDGASKTSLGFMGTPSPSGNHAKIGVSTDGSSNFAIFGHSDSFHPLDHVGLAVADCRNPQSPGPGAE